MTRHDAIAKWLSRCDSEIERRFMLALLLGEEPFAFSPDDEEGFIDAHGLTVTQKHRVRVNGRSFVTDFAFPSTRLDVEIDGAIFHDAADQVHHDRQRDRLLMSMGWRTIRFSEREIVTNALDCAREAVLLARLDGRPRAEQLPLLGQMLSA